MKKILTNKYFYLSAGVVLVVVLIVASRNGGESYEYVKVARSDVRQEVSVTGKVKPVESVSLSFERGGRISSVPVRVGDRVAAGQALLRLDTTDEYLELRQAEAALAADQARLLELRQGTRSEDMAVLESKLSAAETGLLQARQKLLDSIRSAYTIADDATRNYADQFFDNPRSSNPEANIPVADSQLKVDLNVSRSSVESFLGSWGPLIKTLSLDSDLISDSKTARGWLGEVRSFLDKLAFVVNALTPTQTLSATTITTYRTSISTARSAVNTALASLTTQEEGLATAISTLDLAQKNLALAKAGTVPEKILAQEALVASDEAKISAARHKIAVSVIVTPFSGLVTKQDGKQGEVTAANQELVSVISDEGLEVEAFAPEVDIGSVSVGDETEVTFDAFPSEVFMGTVAYIDPAETIIDGVPTYKIRLSISVEDQRVRPGMTANLAIQVAERINALSVPYRAILGKNSERYVLVQRAEGAVTEVLVEIGIRGVNGEVEIVNGLGEGDTVAIPQKK